MYINRSLTITIYSIEFDNQHFMTLTELKGRAHDAALKVIAKSKTPSNYVFKKNEEFLIGHDLKRAYSKVLIAGEKGTKVELTDKVREISDEEFEEIKQTAASYFKNLNEEEKREDKKELHKEIPSQTQPQKNENEKTRARLSAREYFEERVKKQASDIEKRSLDEKTERIKRFEKRMADRAKKIEDFKRSG